MVHWHTHTPTLKKKKKKEIHDTHQFFSSQTFAPAIWFNYFQSKVSFIITDLLHRLIRECVIIDRCSDVTNCGSCNRSIGPCRPSTLWTSRSPEVKNSLDWTYIFFLKNRSVLFLPCPGITTATMIVFLLSQAEGNWVERVAPVGWKYCTQKPHSAGRKIIRERRYVCMYTIRYWYSALGSVCVCVCKCNALWAWQLIYSLTLFNILQAPKAFLTPRVQGLSLSLILPPHYSLSHSFPLSLSYFFHLSLSYFTSLSLLFFLRLTLSFLPYNPLVFSSAPPPLLSQSSYASLSYLLLYCISPPSLSLPLPLSQSLPPLVIDVYGTYFLLTNRRTPRWSPGSRQADLSPTLALTLVQHSHNNATRSPINHYVPTLDWFELW